MSDLSSLRSTSSRSIIHNKMDKHSPVIYDTCVLLNKKRTLGLDYEPNGYAFLNYGDKSPKWVFIKSKTFPQAYSIRPANNIELALTFDEKRNAATVKPAQVNSSANQFWTITDRDNLKSVIDNESELNLDILSQNAGAKAYLHKPSPGYMTPDEDSDNETLYGKSVSTVDFVGGKKYRYNSRGENVPVANPRHNSSSSVGLFNRQPIYTESEISSMTKL